MADLKKEIEEANAKFMTAFNKGDAKAVSELYTEDCRIMPTGEKTLFGKQSVVAVFDSVMKAGAKSILLTVEEVGPLDSSAMAYERSIYEFKKENGESFDKGKYVVLWKKVNGQWYLYTDIFNSSVSS